MLLQFHILTCQLFQEYKLESNDSRYYAEYMCAERHDILPRL